MDGEEPFADYLAWAREEAGIVFPKVKVSVLPAQERLSSPPSPSVEGCGADDDDKVDVARRSAPSSPPQRGLFAAQTIFPGERVLLVPSASLLGAGTLQRLGSQHLQEEERRGLLLAEPGSAGGEADASGDRNETGRGKVDARAGEAFVLASIERLRRILLQVEDEDESTAESSPVLQVAQDVGFEWRDDDAVAVYLACCRSLLRDDPEYLYYAPPSPSVSDSDRIAVHDPSPLQDCVAEEPPPITDAVPLAENLISSVSCEVRVCEEASPALPEPERACQSFLPAVAVLPESFPTSPLYYSEDELARIDGTNCAEYARRMRQQFESDHAKLFQVLRAYDKLFAYSRSMENAHGSHPPIPPSLLRNRFCLHERVTFDSYKWALCNIYSRSSDFMIHSRAPSASTDDVPRFRVIAPLFDMMNHDFISDIQHSLDLEEHSSGDLSVFNGSDRAIEIGEEIRLCYGNFSNEKLLLIYGFVLEPNPYDAVAIYAPLSPSDPLYVAKCRLLQSRCDVEDPNEPHLLKKPHAAPATADETTSHVQSILPASLLSVLRLTGVQSAEELMSIMKALAGDSDSDRSSSPTASIGIPLISVDNERSALLALQDALYKMSRHLALNLISDEGLRRGQGSLLSPVPEEEGNEVSSTVRRTNARNSRILCQSEYEILQLALAEIHDRLSALGGYTKDQQ